MVRASCSPAARSCLPESLPAPECHPEGLEPNRFAHGLNQCMTSLDRAMHMFRGRRQAQSAPHACNCAVGGRSVRIGPYTAQTGMARPDASDAGKRCGNVLAVRTADTHE